MKTKLLKFLIGTAVMLPLAGTAVLAEIETDSAGNTDMKDSVCCLNSVMPDVEWNGGSEKKDEQMPVSVSGTDGVDWFITSRNVLVFEAGELNRDDSWKNFSSCIREIRVVPNEKFDKLILPEDSTKLFSGLCSLTYIDSSRFDTSRVTGMNSMFADCRSLESLDLSSFDTGSVLDLRYLCSGCRSLQKVDLSNFDASHISNFNGMFYECPCFENQDLSGFYPAAGLNTVSINLGIIAEGSSGVRWVIDKNNVLYFEAGELNRSDEWSSFRQQIQEIRVVPNEKFDKLILPADCSKLFRGFLSLEHIDASSFDTRKAVDMSWMFEECESLKSLDVSSFDTSNVVDMSGMFDTCESLKGLDVSSFDTRNVTAMKYMFCCGHSLQNLDLSGFDTSKVTSMELMFAACSSLEALDLSGFDTRNVSVFREMFWDCSSLKRLDLSSFDTSLANQIQSCEMFCKCPSLQEINLSKDFFKGDMSLSYRPTPKRIWVNANNQSSIKTWEEMNQTWNDGDAGWWIIIHNTALLESI